MTQSPLRGSDSFPIVTGSQSLALGLALVAAPQLCGVLKYMIAMETVMICLATPGIGKLDRWKQL